MQSLLALDELTALKDAGFRSAVTATFKNSLSFLRLKGYKREIRIEVFSLCTDALAEDVRFYWWELSLSNNKVHLVCCSYIEQEVLTMNGSWPRTVIEQVNKLGSGCHTL